MTRLGRIKGQVLAYMNKHPGQLLHISDIAAATGFTEKQIRGTINNARYMDERLANDIEVYVAGQTWCYRPRAEAEPEPRPAPRPNLNNENPDLFEKVGRTTGGTDIVRDVNGTMFKLVELDI